MVILGVAFGKDTTDAKSFPVDDEARSMKWKLEKGAIMIAREFARDWMDGWLVSTRCRNRVQGAGCLGRKGESLIWAQSLVIPKVRFCVFYPVCEAVAFHL